ncbi:beta-2-microglobulin [Alligator mississippiensis]|uniref:Beta-2-microglobulin n=1 Tax=Alligator mississippiensis TaxID=8496 RepID=A0A151MAE5_ALLMI|nr:beta-2-microglobulin [Alligator mississippiensis]
MARAESFKTVLILLVALVGLACVEATQRSPKVQVYTRYPLGSKESNFLNCYVEGFHPPKIDIKLLKNGKEMDGVIVGDLSFSNDWTFQRLMSSGTQITEPSSSAKDGLEVVPCFAL